MVTLELWRLRGSQIADSTWPFDRGVRGSAGGESIKGQHKFCSILWSGKQMALRMLPNRSNLNRSSPGGSDGTREANCKLCLCASADRRWLVFASEDFSNGCSTCGLSWTPGNSGGGDNRAWWVFAVGGLYQGDSERLAPPHRHQSIRVLLEFLRPLGDGLRFAGRFNVAKPHGFFPKDQDRPPNILQSCPPGLAPTCSA